MLYSIYMLFDEKSEMFVGNPFLMVNNATAIRTTSSIVRDKNNPFSSTADDLVLFNLGQFNIGTGEIIFNKQKVVACIDLISNE